ncbi:MAG TPA: phosphosulfolactate synthase [Gaiellaceae bacterium]|nr:phosphosulfolactate synthase [Gaiellaceae bacterium]
MTAPNFDLGLKRDGGLTHVLDKGLGPRGWEDVLETSGDYIDIVKLGWGTAYITKSLRRKLDILKDKPVVIGGTFFEAVWAKGKLDEYKRWLADLGLTHVEISDGTVEIPREEKLALIADFARDFTVLSEVGSKDSDVVFAPYQWVAWMTEEKAAGAWKVITEAREGGTAGIFRADGDMRTGLIDEIAHSLDFHDIVWEAPTKSSQAWFIRHFGPEVNLGNIPPDEVIPLETLRLGLRGDTLKEVLLG